MIWVVAVGACVMGYCVGFIRGYYNAVATCSKELEDLYDKVWR